MTTLADLNAATDQRFTARDFALESGGKLPEMTLIFDTYGRLAPDGANAILVTHGYTGSHRAAGPPTSANPAGGWWKGLIGPGLAIDTDRYFVVSSNMLGSSYGSTGPNSVNPATGKPYGPDFPDITLGDIVRAQRLMLDSLGVRHLVAVAGQSFGGFQAFQWAISYPDFMEGIVASVTAPKGSGGEASVKALLAQLAADPNWNGGWHYERGGMPATMTALRMDTLRRYGTNEILAATVPDPPRPRGPHARDGRAVGARVRPELAGDPAQGDGPLRRRARPREDPRPGALRPVAHGRPLPAVDGPRRHGQAERGRRGRHLRGDRQRLRPPGLGRRLREVGPGPEGVPRPRRPVRTASTASRLAAS